MPWPLTALFVTGALLLTTISATLSFLFCRTLGTGPVEGLAYGTAAATIDVLKVLAPFALAQAWRNGQFGRGLAAVLVWIIAVVVSLSSAMGLAAEKRLGKSGAHDSLQAQFHEAQRELGDYQARLAALDAARPAKEVEAHLQSALARPMITPKRVRTLAAASSNCTKPDHVTAAACAEIGRLRSEWARAGERDRLEAEMRALRGKLDDLRGKGAGEGSEGDRQAGVIMRVVAVVTGITTTLPRVQTALIALIAIALEVASSCSLFAALGSHVLRQIDGMPERRVAEPIDIPARTSGSAAEYCQERTTATQGARLSMRQIHQDYVEWCRARGDEPMERGQFMRELRREGHGRRWSMAGGVIHHVGLGSQ